MKHLLAVLFAAGVTSLFAETLAWYHFDEVAPGEKPTTETRFLNAVDPAVAPGRPISQIDWETKTDDDTYFPQGAAAFPGGFSVLDPVSGFASENARSLVFTTEKQESGKYNSSGVEIADDPVLATGKMTYECLVRFDPSRTPDGINSNCKRVILCKNKDDYGLGFILDYDYWGDWGRTLSVRVNCADGSQVKVEAKDLQLVDGLWHHVAMTMDDEEKAVRLYYDYSLVGEATEVTSDLSQTSGKVLTVGYSDKDNYTPRWGGVIDELRISNAVLTPLQMLKVQASPAARPVDKDTAAYQSFSAFRSEGVADFPPVMQMRNEAIGEGSLGEPDIHTKGPAPTRGSSVPIQSVGTAEGRVENLASIFLEKASDGDHRAKTWCFNDPDKTLLAGDYTAEMFFRASTVYTEDQVCLMAHGDKGVLYVNASNINLNWNTKKVSGNFLDGKWHHVALVFDKEKSRYTVFVDYTERTYQDVTIDETQKNWDAFRFGGTSSSYWNPFYDIDIDETRITRRALNPDEFIHPYDSTVAWEVSCDASDILASRIWSTVPDLGSMKDWYFDASDKAGEQVADDILSELRENESSIATTGGVNRCGGIVLNDPERSVVTGPFTVEFCYQLADGYVPSSSEYMFFIHHGCHIQLDGTTLYIQDGNWKDIAKNYAPADGKWHHVAVIYDPDKGEFRAYFDYVYLGSREGSIDPAEVGDAIYISNDKWGQSPRTWKFDNVRVTRKALKPCEFLTSKHVEGPTLAWAYFDNGVGSFAQEYDEAATYSGEATFASRGAGAAILDAEGNVLHENKGSLRVLSGGASYSRLSLLERTDLTAELFLRASTTTSIADGTDVLSLTVKDASPIWSLRADGGALKVFVGDTALANAGAVPAIWTHFAVVFDPSADGLSTAVRVYRNHELVDGKSFAGTLAVDGLRNSSLKIGSFDGAVDELRFSKGALGAKDMLYRFVSKGMFLIYR